MRSDHKMLRVKTRAQKGSFTTDDFIMACLPTRPWCALYTHLQHDIYHLELLLELPLRFCDVTRVPLHHMHLQGPCSRESWGILGTEWQSNGVIRLVQSEGGATCRTSGSVESFVWEFHKRHSVPRLVAGIADRRGAKMSCAIPGQKVTSLKGHEKTRSHFLAWPWTNSYMHPVTRT